MVAGPFTPIWVYICFLDQESEVYDFKDESLGLGMEISGRVFAQHVQCPQHHKEEEGKKKKKEGVLSGF